MRIGINGVFLDSKQHGVDSYTRGLVGFLASNPGPHEVILYMPAPTLNPLPSALRWRKTPAGLGAAHGTLGNATRLIWMQTVFPWLLRQDKVDILFSPIAEGMIYPTLRQVIVVHDVMPLFYPEENPRLRLYYRWVLPSILGRASRIIAASFHTKQDLMRCFSIPEEKIDLVYNGLDPLYFSSDSGECPEGAERGDFFLYVGTCSPRKNLHTVIRAFAKVHRELPQRLVVVSYPDRYTGDILALAGELGVRDRMTFLSGLAPRQLLYLYRKATALLLLSEYEGFGYPPLEAMALGTPAIVSDATALAELAGKACIRVPPKDIDAVISAMRTLGGDPVRRRTWGEIGAAHAREFTWDRAGRAVREILERSLQT